jgi:hypothetical protein
MYDCQVQLAITIEISHDGIGGRTQKWGIHYGFKCPVPVAEQNTNVVCSGSLSQRRAFHLH